MTLKETILQELETADDQLLEEVMRVIRSRTTPKPTMTITDAIAELRRNMSPEELDPSADDIWENVRDRTPVSGEPRMISFL
jgi:divalent metal cation (Fe/Co/Zn/Cd) transporter